MTVTHRVQIHRSKLARDGNKRIELTLSPAEQSYLGPRPAQALKSLLKNELERMK
jgi:hypothetical protein